ncbi:tRNA-specific 2-thiouridylase mnmA [uncultured Ruminococcus sp.]|nr:tRNA-specific 2-thiouridylase mnmA [uncultured Ruminococcus sp.]
MTNKMKKVLLGMSGGVDSSAAALVLQRAGYAVAGVTLSLQGEKTRRSDAVQDARRVAEKLGIEHRVIDLTEEFDRHVVAPFAADYLAGRTPNPCVACNRHIKFGAMLRYALAEGFDAVATGHYAVVEQDEAGRYQLYRAQTEKDQSYVLYSLTQQQLAHVLFPLAAYAKDEVRALAGEAGLPVAQKPDSQEICFVEGNDYVAFLKQYVGELPPPGDFVDEAGALLGRHKGLAHYTVGQRKGLGCSFGKPMYVVRLEPDGNRVVLGGEGRQYAPGLVARDVNWIAFDSLAGRELPLRCTAKIRYKAEPAPCRAEPLPAEMGGGIRVLFDTPRRSVTPGQAVVFYDGSRVLGGGVIAAPLA